MPPRPRSPRPRPTPSRRPRVAGMAPAVPRPAERIEEQPGDAAETRVPPAPERAADPAPPAGKATAERPRPKPAPATEPAPAEAEAESDTVSIDRTEQLAVVPAENAAGKQAKPARKPSRKTSRSGADEIAEPTEVAAGGGSAEVAAPGRGARFTATVRRHAVPLLAVAAVVLATVAVVAGIQDAHLRGSPAAQNSALVDVGTTAEVSGQLSDAIETVYSFDFARLDENEKAARDVITPEFAADFDRLFGEVKARAPQQQAVVSATVTRTAVKEITGDRAVLVAFVDQQATRAAPDAQSQQLAADGRLAVTGERVDGRWKIAAVTPL
jgi:Mce-associated membrane protein